MSLVGATQSRTNAAETNSAPRPLPATINEMKAKIDLIFQQAFMNSQSTDASSLVKRATTGTPDDTGPFS